METRPLVSIIINNYNYANFIAEAINSALNQTYSSVEVIVVDDGSTDNSQAIISSFIDRVKPVFKPNGGQASAFNAGFAASCGEIICFLDADDLFLPEKVTEVVNIFQKYSEINWCFHDVQLVTGDGKNTVGNSPKNNSFQCDLREKIKQGKVLDKSSCFYIPPTSGLCFRRSLLEQILPMPESIKITSDAYLQHAALFLSQGFILGKPLVLQRIHGQNHFTRNKNRPTTQAQVYIPISYWLKYNFPALSKLTNNFIAHGLGLIWYYQISDFNHQLLQDYLKSVPLLERVLINLRASYYFLINFLKSIPNNFFQTNA